MAKKSKLLKETNVIRKILNRVIDRYENNSINWAKIRELKNLGFKNLDFQYLESDLFDVIHKAYILLKKSKMKFALIIGRDFYTNEIDKLIFEYSKIGD